MQEIEADWTTLVLQSPETVNDYLIQAVSSIDNKFGDGYAANNPVLVAAFLQSCSADFRSAAIGIAAQKIRDAMRESAQTLADVWRPQ